MLECVKTSLFIAMGVAPVKVSLSRCYLPVNATISERIDRQAHGIPKLFSVAILYPPVLWTSAISPVYWLLLLLFLRYFNFTILYSSTSTAPPFPSFLVHPFLTSGERSWARSELSALPPSSSTLYPFLQHPHLYTRSLLRLAISHSTRNFLTFVKTTAIA